MWFVCGSRSVGRSCKMVRFTTNIDQNAVSIALLHFGGCVNAEIVLFWP